MQNIRKFSILILLSYIGYFSCASCKHTGSWNMFKSYLDNKFNKKNYTKEESDRIKELVENITKSTFKFKESNSVSEILTKFKLPVSS